jgi:hypothetical protein
MQRKLSWVESLLWMGGLQSSIFSMVATIRGGLSLEAFQDALDKARQRHPTLSVRIVLADDHHLHITSEAVADFPIQVVQRENDHTWISVVESELKIIYPWRTGPFVRFALVSAPDCTELIVTCHHGYADGLAAAYLLRDLLTYLGDPGKPVEALPEIPAADDLIPPSIDLGEVRVSPDVLVYEADILPAPQPTTEAFFVLPRMFSAEQTEALLKRCRAENTTVHGAISAAFLKAFAEKRGYGQHIVSSAVNVRDRLAQPVGEAFGLFIIPSMLATIDCTPEGNFWDAARKIKADFQGQMTDEQLFGIFKGVRQMFSSMSYREVVQAAMTNPWEMNYDVSITNLGRLNFPTEYGDLRLEALYGPLVNALEKETILGVVTVGGQMTLTWVGRHKTLDPVEAEAIQAIALDCLEEAVR